MISVSLRKCYPRIRLAVDLAFEEGILVLFGPSGAGKSLTLKHIAGLERPDGGWIRVDDLTLFDSATGVDLPPQQRRVGYVPQQASLFPHLSALENIAMPLWRAHGWSRQRAHEHAREMLHKVDLINHADERPARLSGGQRQRVAFARAMAIDPAVILLDEPFAALDAPARAELRLEFKRLQAEFGAPTITITHDLEEAVLLGDQIAVILDGSIHQLARPREVLDRPADRRVAELIQAKNIIPGRIDADDPQLITTPIGQLRVDDRQSPGMTCHVVVRPDSIRILREDRETGRLQGANILEGTLLTATDLGSMIALQVGMGASALEVRLPPTSYENLHLEPGQPLRLAIRPNQIHVIEEHEPAQATASGNDQ